MTKTASTPKKDAITVETLHPNEFAKWDALVDRSPHGTVFHNSWWLEATENAFDILVCRDEGGELVAGIPLPRKKRMGLTLFHSPQLTPYLGPIFDLSRVEGMSDRLSMMRRLGESLARAIKGYDSFFYTIGTTAPDFQGFLWAGFRAELAYTFRFDAGLAADELLQGMAGNHRWGLRKAQRLQTMAEVDNRIDVLMDLNKQTFTRQGMALPYPENLPRRLWAAAHSRGQANIYLSRTLDGEFVAGLLVVHDARCSYQIVAGINPETQSTGGSNLIEWHAIQDALHAGRAFDFEGSSLRGVERYYRRWGADARPIWLLDKAGSLVGTLARTVFRAMSPPEF